MSWLRAVVCLAVFCIALPSFCQAPDPAPNPVPKIDEIRHLLEQLAPQSADPCGPPYDIDSDRNDSESKLFSAVTDSIVSALNAPAPASASPQQRVAALSDSLQQLSAKINAAWPDENRLHLHLYGISRVLTVKMTIRTQDAFAAFAPTQPSGSVAPFWANIGSDELGTDRALGTRIDLHPLQSGPSGNPRFLARILLSGCAGSLGIKYQAWEWDRRNSDYLNNVLDITGSLGLDDRVPGFPQIGEFKTAGTRISLPWCWFSPIDTWDNPSLCAEDTWDVSGDRITFVARRWNRPDLLPIAKALDYAAHQDYPAVRSYCANAAVAQRLVRDAPDHFDGTEVKVVPAGPEEERVSTDNDSNSAYEVVKHGGRWLVAAFH